MRKTNSSFTWTQKWKSINNLNFSEENFSTLMNIQAWLQLNLKIEFTVYFSLLHKHDKQKTALTYPRGDGMEARRKNKDLTARTSKHSFSKIYITQMWNKYWKTDPESIFSGKGHRHAAYSENNMVYRIRNQLLLASSTSEELTGRYLSKDSSLASMWLLLQRKGTIEI